MTRAMFSRYGVWLVLGCIVAVNGFMLGKVYLNRSKVVAAIELTERELRTPYGYSFAGEDSSLRVSLQWAAVNKESVNAQETWAWYPDRRLELSATHFNSFEFPACTNDYRNPRKKSGWVLLEFNGRAYQDFVARAEQHHAAVHASAPSAATEFAEKELSERKQSAKEFLQSAKTKQSRLFVIDAAADKALLDSVVANYDRPAGATLLIVPAEVQPDYNRCDEKNESKTGVQITNLAVESLYVPREFARDFPTNAPSTEQPFSARIAYGRFYEPWVTEFNLSEGR